MICSLFKFFVVKPLFCTSTRVKIDHFEIPETALSVPKDSHRTVLGLKDQRPCSWNYARESIRSHPWSWNYAREYQFPSLILKLCSWVYQFPSLILKLCSWRGDQFPSLILKLCLAWGSCRHWVPRATSITGRQIGDQTEYKFLWPVLRHFPGTFS